MTLRLSSDGPEFPSELVDSLLAGEVVFLCGTGVSAPQMPGFRSLVERTYQTLAVEMSDSERDALGKGFFEEVLGSLSRRLSDPHAVTRTVSELLKVPEHPCLDQHRTILRLSRDLDNRITVVTTNFDTLLERAISETMPATRPGDISFAGQALPAPGSPSFSGIIHLHGCLVDHKLGLEHTPLVITSADYGDAYMRSGWASRFLFDLARCKAIVLLGYSAHDAPVRYFLNVLEADRTRFPDLNPVYAFSAYETDPEIATRSWDMLAVMPLPYSKINPEDGGHNHYPLWRDLAALADIVDRPKRSRQERARAILERPAAGANANSRRELAWLFGGRRDLWSVVLDTVSDSEWFKVFQDEDLWVAEDAIWVTAAWVARNFQDHNRFECACEWQRRLGRAFTQEIERRLLHAQGLDETWTRVWRLFCLVDPSQDHDMACYETQQRLTSGVVLDSDLRRAVNLLAPRLLLSRSYRELRDDSEPIERLRDIVRPRMTISSSHGVEDLIDSLCAMPDRASQILDLATAELRSALELEAELELIGEDHDINDSTVPSIESHAQNQFHEGVIFLVRLLAESVSQAATLDRDHARRVVASWETLPGRIGLRLCLHAMRSADLFDADEAMSSLLSISDTDFWLIRREIALLLKERTGTASPALVNQVEERIRESGDAYYDRFPIAPGEADWPAQAHDTAVWLRLTMLLDADVLSATGATDLSAITERREYLNRAVEDRDFFWAYGSEVRRIIGDPAPIIEASEDDRLQVALGLAQSPDLDLQEGWSEFCRSHRQGAFDSLCTEDVTPANGALWNQFLHGLVFGDEASKEIREDLSVGALEHLSRIDADELQPMISGLCDLIFFAPRKRVRDVDGWLVKLWKTIAKRPEEAIDFVGNLYESAIKFPAGKLSDTLLLEIETRTEEGDAPTEAQRKLIKDISECKGAAGQIGRAVLVRHLAFLLTIDQPYIDETLSPCINSADVEGAALRAVMLRYSAITPMVTRVFSQAVMKGVVRSEITDRFAATNIAANILRPALADLRGDTAVQWGLTATDVAEALRRAPQAIRCGALEVLARWLREDDAGVEEAFRLIVIPFFEKVWPKERDFRHASLTPHLIDLAVGSRNEFPTALKLMQPYISPYDRDHASLHAIVSSEAPERFPRETLELVWLVCGPKSRKSSHGV